MDMKDETKSQTKTNLNVKGASPTEETSGQEAQETVVQNPLQEMKELLQRTQANFENYRKQMEKQIIEVRKMAAAEIILQILPVVDNFELALKMRHMNFQLITVYCELRNSRFKKPLPLA